MASGTPASHVSEPSASLDRDESAVQEVTSSASANEPVDGSAPPTVENDPSPEETKGRAEADGQIPGGTASAAEGLPDSVGPGVMNKAEGEADQDEVESAKVDVSRAAKDANMKTVADKIAAAYADQRETSKNELQDIDFIDNVGSNLSPFHIYVAVNGKSFSCPSKEQAEALRRPLRNSIEHKVSGSASGCDYSFITIHHYATGMRVYNSTVGETRVTVKDMNEFQVKSITDPEEALATLRKFNKDVQTPPAEISTLTFKTSRADHNVEWMALESLSQTQEARQVARPQMKELAEMLSKTSDQLNFEVLILPTGIEHTAKLRQFEATVNALHEHETGNDPLEIFFNANDQTKKQKTLPLSQIPNISVEDFPKLKTQPRHTRYVNHEQQVVHQLVGTANEFRAEEFRINELRANEFKVAVLPCPHVQDESRCMLIILPAGKSQLLPQNGESCRVHLPMSDSGMDDHTEHVISEIEIRAIASNIEEVFAESSGEIGEIELVKEEVSKYFAEDLTDDTIKTLLRSADESKADYGFRIFTFCNEQQRFLDVSALGVEAQRGRNNRFSASPGPSANTLGLLDDRLDWCYAIRLDIDVLRANPEWQTYLVQKPKSIRDSKSDFDYVDRMSDETWNKYIERITSEKFLKRVRVERVSSDKAVKAECLALNPLQHPKSSPIHISDESMHAFKYQLRFDPAEKPTIDLFQQIEEIGLVRDRKAPQWLLDEIDAMDKPKRSSFEMLDNMPAGMKFIPGVAACGKSTLLRNIIFSAFFGRSENSSDVAKHANRKILYCVNNNAAVDTFARNLQSKMSRLELGENAPDIVRMYSMDSEVARMVSKGKKPLPDSFNGDAASQALEQFTETDCFLAQYVIIRAQVFMHRTRSQVRGQKSACRNMSLQEAAVRYHMDQREKHPKLDVLLQKAETGVEMGNDDVLGLQKETKQLYQDFLGKFQGIVCCTPVAASNYQFRTNFSPHLVHVDEGGRLRELELLILVAWFRGPWVIVGDKQQLGPFVHMDPSARNEVQSNNPFVKQLGYSTLARAVDAGATDAYLTVNHRAYGNLVQIPSKLIYRNWMEPPVGKNRYPKSVLRFHHFLARLVPSISEKDQRVLVHFPGSWAHTIGSSFFNLAHVRWALARIREVVTDTSFTTVDGQGATVLVMPYYRAQLQMYETEFSKMVGKHITPEEASRVKFATLDSSQGDEADLCIIDLVLTDHIGFTGDERRQCLALTRSRQAEIVIAGPGMFIGREHDPAQETRAAILRRLHTVLEQNMAIAAIKTCSICEIPDADHEKDSCRNTTFEYHNIACRSCDPKLFPAHNGKTCENIRCRRCACPGHRTSECDAPFPCSRCHQHGHRIDECVNRQHCSICGELGHFNFECMVACKHCHSKDHASIDCADQSCARCHRKGHHISKCNAKAITCKTCKEVGHSAPDCPDKTCRNCLEVGHYSFECHKPKVKRCNTCNMAGHVKKDCPQRPPMTCTICGGDHSKDCVVDGGQWTKTDLTSPAASGQTDKDAMLDSLLGRNCPTSKSAFDDEWGSGQNDESKEGRDAQDDEWGSGQNDESIEGRDA